MQADLHIHTHYSDSTQSPQEVVTDALKAQLGCIAITDHDTIDGILPTRTAGEGEGLEVLSGVELSSEVHGKDVHMLGYLFNIHDETFCRKLTTMQNARIERMAQMIEKLKKIGIPDISLEEVCSRAESNAVGRPHLASTMLEKGIITSIPEAFNKYLAEGQPAYVPKFKIHPHEAIAMIKDAGGIAVLAHPMITSVDELIPGFVKNGLGGIEVYYPTHSTQATKYYENIARKHGIAMTGGSDAHGKVKKHTYVGKIKIDYGLVEQLKTVLSKG